MYNKSCIAVACHVAEIWSVIYFLQQGQQLSIYILMSGTTRTLKLLLFRYEYSISTLKLLLFKYVVQFLFTLPQCLYEPHFPFDYHIQMRTYYKCAVGTVGDFPIPIPVWGKNKNISFNCSCCYISDIVNHKFHNFCIPGV